MRAGRRSGAQGGQASIVAWRLGARASGGCGLPEQPAVWSFVNPVQSALAILLPCKLSCIKLNTAMPSGAGNGVVGPYRGDDGNKCSVGSLYRMGRSGVGAAYGLLQAGEAKVETGDVGTVQCVCGRHVSASSPL
jgi:hypothetical protein